MNTLHKIFFSSLLTLSIVSVTSLQSVIKSSSRSSDTKKLIDKKEFESVTPTAKQHFCAVKEIGDMLWVLINAELQKTDGSFQWVMDSRQYGANPYHHQTKQGIFLVTSYGKVTHVWTPWGAVALIGGGSYNEGSMAAWEKICGELFKSISVEFYKRISHFSLAASYCIDVYKVIAINGRVLPEAVLRDYSGQFVGEWIVPQTVEQVWDELAVEYEQTRDFEKEFGEYFQ
jgi:hypothetical protein